MERHDHLGRADVLPEATGALAKWCGAVSWRIGSHGLQDPSPHVEVLE